MTTYTQGDIVSLTAFVELPEFAETVTETLADPEFWYESCQNWQSEFLSLGVLLVLGIYLPQRGSPESKPVAAPYAATGH
jgi:hypothetical protein